MTAPSAHPQPARTGSRAVFTDGVFDLFHVNHLAILREAAALGDRLVVGVTSDAVTKANKRRPVIGERERMQIVAGLSCVDTVILLDRPLTRDYMCEIIERYDIARVVYAGDATPDFYIEPESRGIMVRLPYHAGTSTSAIINRIRDRPDLG